MIGFLLAGFLADFKDQRFFTVSVICVYMIAVFAPILLADQKFLYLNMGLMYLYLSFLVMYFNVTFFEIAGKSDNPEFYAPLGRIIDTVTSILFSYFAVSMNTYAVLAVHLALLVIAWSIQIWKVQGTSAEAVSMSDDQTMEKFIQSFSLTEREQDIARRILVKSESIKEMSLQLFISERVIYRHLNRIYEKTGTDSRMGLLLKYQEYMTKHNNH